MREVLGAIVLCAVLAVLPATAQAHLSEGGLALGWLTDDSGIVHDHDVAFGELGEFTPGGFTSGNVEHVAFVPFELGTGTGSRIVGDYMYVTGWKSFSIYDISVREQPQLVAFEPVGFRFENEDVPGNDTLMMFSEELPQDVLHVYDTSDKANPVEVSRVPGAGDHTTECLMDCTWSYGTSGAIVDLRDPANATLVRDPNGSKRDWRRLVGLEDGTHDVYEFRRGRVLVSTYSEDFLILDVRDPLNPVVLDRGPHPDPEDWIFHSGRWPDAGKDRFVLMQGEQNFQPRCHDQTGPFLTYDTRKRTADGKFRHLDTFRLDSGAYADGSPAVNALGCSAHWFEEHETFDDGGLVAMGYYEHGTRFLNVDGAGQISQVGWFLPYASSTSAAHWADERTIYAIDYARGFDILRWTGPLPKRGPLG